MELTKYSDYSIRVLVYLGLNNGKLVSINEIAEFYDISRNHLTKVVNNLANLELIFTVRGKGGGIKLALPAEEIYVGRVIRATEPNFNLLECFDPVTNKCRITNCCILKGVMKNALEAFFTELDKYTLTDILANTSGLKRILEKHSAT
ncbi:Rrf2 family transcriptional regulator [Puniceicoccaceae bacterium K14]|nr:Rrf2 family transcriptional regulator [Puniceicoccaceae bacterium K14]